MNILVKEDRTSTFVHDDWFDSTEIRGTQEIWHLAIRCRHDRVMISTEEGVWCPDCENEQMTTGEIVAYSEAWAREMCDPYGGDGEDD
jgi:hypothetical protein